MPTLTPPRPDEDTRSQEDFDNQFEKIANHPDNQDLSGMTKKQDKKDFDPGDDTSADWRQQAVNVAAGKPAEGFSNQDGLPNDAQDRLASQEYDFVKKTTTQTDTSKENVTGEFPTDFKKKSSNEGQGGNPKKKGIIAMVTGGGVLGIVVAIFSLFMNLFPNFTIPTVDHILKPLRAAAHQRAVKTANERYFDAADCKGIKCRVAGGVSDAEIEQMKKAGLKPVIEVIPTGQKKITSFELADGTSVTKANFLQTIQSNKVFYKQFSKVSQVKAKMFRASAVVKKISKLGIKRTNPLAGATTEREMRSAIRARQLGVDPGGSRLNTGLVDENGVAIADDPENPRTSELNNTSTDASRQALIDDPDLAPDTTAQGALSKLRAAKGVAESLGTIAGSLKITGQVENACLVYSGLRAADIATKYSRKISELANLGIILDWSDATRLPGTTGDQQKFMMDKLFKPSPTTGKSFFESDGMQKLLFNGTVGDEAAIPFAVGTATGGFLTEVRNAVTSVLGTNASDTCHFLGRWYVQIGTIALSVLAAPISLAKAIPSVAFAVAIQGTVFYLQSVVEGLAKGTDTMATLEQGGGDEQGNAYSAGLGALQEQVGATIGGRPATVTELDLAMKETGKNLALYEPDERSMGTKLYENMASLSFGFIGSAYSMSPQGLIASTVGAINSSVAMTSKVGAADVEEDSIAAKKCRDLDYQKLGIACDDWGNTIMIMPSAEINKHTDVAIFDFMVDKGIVNATTGEPTFDATPTFSDTLEGIAGTSSAGARDSPSYYAYYKFYCADNVTPITQDADVDATRGFLPTDCLDTEDETLQIYRQYWAILNATDDGSDTPDGKGTSATQDNRNAALSAVSPEFCKGDEATMTTGQKVACSTYQFDNYGYLWGGGHGESAEAFMTAFKAGEYTAGEDSILDCSGLARMAIYIGTGVDVGGIGSGSFKTDSHFKEVPNKEEATAGDLLVWEGHIEVIVSNNPAEKIFTTFGAHTESTEFSKQVGETTYAYDDDNGSGGASVVVRYAE